MGLIRTLTARCDGRVSPDTTSRVYACGATEKLDPDATQPYRVLVERGWSLRNTDDGIEIYCPRHDDQARVQAPSL